MLGMRGGRHAQMTVGAHVVNWQRNLTSFTLDRNLHALHTRHALITILLDVP